MYFIYVSLYVSFQYNENLIMVAIRAGQEKMAEFLIDNDVDVTHTTKLIVSDGNDLKYC